MRALITLLVIILPLAASSQNTFFKSYPYWDRSEANAVFEENDGYVFAGCGDIDENGFLFLMKVNFTGDSIWIKHFAINRNSAFITDFATDGEGNKFLIVPQLEGAGNVFKFDNNWNLVFNGNFNNIIPSNIKILNDNNFLVFSQYAGHNKVHKINSDSYVEIWASDSLIGEKMQMQHECAMVETMNGEYVITLKNLGLEPVGVSSTIYNLNSNGELISQFTFEEFVLGTTMSEAGNLISLAYRDNDINGFNALVTYQPNGTILSTSDITLANTSYQKFIEDNGKKIMVGNYFGSGLEFYHNALGGFQENVNIWSENHGDPLLSFDRYYPAEIIKTSDNGYLVVGTLDSTTYMPYLLKTDSVGQIVPLGIQEETNNNNFQVNPNPATDYIILTGKNKLNKETTVELYNSNGILVSSSILTGNNSKINIEKLAKGIYLVKVRSLNEIDVHKLVKI